MFCSNCGKEIQEGTVFCSFCGARIGNNTQVPRVEPVHIPTVEEDAESITDKQKRILIKFMAVLCYAGLYVLIPLFMLKDKKFLRTHVNNGLVLAIFECGAFAISWIPILGLISVIIVYGFCAVMSVLGIINSIKGKPFKMPILGGIKIVK